MRLHRTYLEQPLLRALQALGVVDGLAPVPLHLGQAMPQHLVLLLQQPQLLRVLALVHPP